MSVESARKSSIGFVFDDPNFHDNSRAPRTPLAIHILFEKKNPNSPFKPYLGISFTTLTLDILPPMEEVDTTVLWSEEELEELRGSWLFGS